MSARPIGRQRRSRLYVVIGTALALVAFLAAAGLASAPYLFPTTTTGFKVVVAKNNISARTQITSADLELIAINPRPPQSFTTVASVAGKGARVDIPQGEAVTANLIVNSPDQLSSSDVTYLPIPPGYVAVTIPTSEQVGVAGYVQVSDRIIVLASINTQTFGQAPAVLAVRTVFRDLVVLRVGQGAQTQGATNYTSLTVLLTSCDSEYLFWLLNNAVLKYSLESFHDYGTTPNSPDPKCPSIVSAGGVGPREVDTRWKFTAP